MLKQCKVVMLSTNQKTKYLMVYSDVEKTKGKLILNGLKNDEYKEYQHLYIISDDEIKENNTHFYNPHSGQLHISGNHTDYIAINKNGCKKIIATTDVSLGLPQPSQQFIEKYIEEYNKGNVITDVLVEYDEIYPKHFTYNPSENIITRLKVDKGNIITIKKVKDSYSREEVVKLLIDCCGEVSCEDGKLLGKNPEELYKWIEENL